MAKGQESKRKAASVRQKSLTKGFGWRERGWSWDLPNWKNPVNIPGVQGRLLKHLLQEPGLCPRTKTNWKWKPLSQLSLKPNLRCISGISLYSVHMPEKINVLSVERQHHPDPLQFSIAMYNV